MERFRVLEDDATADIAYVAYGKSLEEMYENAALGLFSLMTDIDSVESVQIDFIKVEAEDREALMLDFLNELIYRWDVDKVLFSDFSCKIKEVEDGLVMTAKCRGETFDEERHVMKVGVKAVTYFGMEVRERCGVWETKITPDV